MQEIMTCFILGVIAAVLIYVFIISCLGIYWFLSSSFEKYAPPVALSGRLKKAFLADIARELKKRPDGTEVVDLGSGWGSLLIPLAKKFPKLKFVGIERAFSPYWVSKIRARNIKNITFVRGDLFLYDLAKTQIVMCFLIGFMMPEITKKCLAELKCGAKVYTCRFSLDRIEPSAMVRLGAKLDKYYVYDF